MIHEPFLREQAGADAFEEGYYLLERSGRVALPVRIWFGPPIDETGAELDRSPRWQVTILGMLVDEAPFRAPGILLNDLTDVWPRCREAPTDKDDHDFRVDRAAYARLHDPNDPYGNGRRVDPMTAPIPFLEA